jgi:signal transduction histidine kinase
MRAEIEMTNAMTKARRSPATVVPTWPILVALGAIALLLLGMVFADLLVARGVASQTADIVGNAERSIELVDDLRAQAHRLTLPTPPARDVVDASSRIAADAAAYDPLATSSGEREEWDHLRNVLARMQAAVRAGRPVSEYSPEVERSIDRLIRINEASARDGAGAIRHIHRQALVVDMVVGGLAFALALLIGAVLIRLLARQRDLVARHIEFVEERNRELDAFAGRAAHDLRVPLNPIRGYADLLSLGTEGPAEVRAMAARIGVAVGRMNRVIDDMLELSRAGRPGPGRALPADALAHVLADLEPELRGAEVTTALTGDAIACGPTILEQIMRNLLENAVKFSSRQRPLRIVVRSERRGPSVAITVEDNGVGMDAESAKLAFEPYFRGYSDREVPGHGLGLAIVERATRALGGSCAIVSSPDAGARVTVKLPAAPAREAAADHAGG